MGGEEEECGEGSAGRRVAESRGDTKDNESVRLNSDAVDRGGPVPAPDPETEPGKGRPELLAPVAGGRMDQGAESDRLKLYGGIKIIPAPPISDEWREWLNLQTYPPPGWQGGRIASVFGIDPRLLGSADPLGGKAEREKCPGRAQPVGVQLAGRDQTGPRAALPVRSRVTVGRRRRSASVEALGRCRLPKTFAMKLHRLFPIQDWTFELVPFRTRGDLTMLHPTADHVIVRAEVRPEKSKGGVFFAETAQEKPPSDGEVVAVGPGKIENGAHVPLELTIGDKIIFSIYAGTKIEHEGETLIVIKADDVLCIKDPEPERPAVTQGDVDAGYEPEQHTNPEE